MMCLQFPMFFSVILLSNIVYDLVFAAQSFVEEPSSIEVNLGQSSATLNCVVRNLTGQVFWFKGDNIIPASSGDRTLPAFSNYQIVGDEAQGEYNLQISNIALSDDGLYECQVTPSVDEPRLRSAPARITVRRPPVSVSIPLSPVQTVTVAEAANLTCEVKGANPAPTVTWLREGQVVGDAIVKFSPSDHISGKLKDGYSVLTITPELGDHGAVYHCQAINAAINAPMTKSVELNVQYPPIVTMGTSPDVLQEDSTVLINCIVDANPASVEYVWKKDDVEVAGDGSQLELSLIKDDHESVITCMVTNSKGTTEASVTLDVQYAPRLVNSPESTSVDKGEMAQLRCSADGNPAPTIKWTRESSRATVSTMQQLQFDSVGENDIGLYKCTATVPGFPSVSAYGRVDINNIPVVESEPVVLGRIGSVVHLECFTETKPVPDNITWSWGSKVLQKGNMEHFVAKEVVTPRGKKGILTIHKVKPSDYGEYNCTMTNTMGSTEAVIILQEQGLEFIFYVIIAVVSASLLIFILSIILMIYCKRKISRKFGRSKTAKSSSSTSSSEDSDSNKVKVEIIRKLSDLHLNKNGNRRPSASTEDSFPPRYTSPHDYIRRRDSWDDPTYRPLSDNRHTPPPYPDEEQRRSRLSSNEYMEPGDPPSKGKRLLDYPDDERHSRRSLREEKNSPSEYSYHSNERGQSNHNRNNTVADHDDDRSYYSDDRDYPDDQISYASTGRAGRRNIDDEQFGYHYITRDGPPSHSSHQGSVRSSEMSLNMRNKAATCV